MVSIREYNGLGALPVPASIAAAHSTSDADKSALRTDVALLVSALFLQRFILPLGNTSLALDFVPTTLILLHQFLSGKLYIQYDRLLWFLAVGISATCSLLINFNSRMLTSYSLFLTICLVLILRRPSTPDRYRRTLRAFQTIVILLSSLAILQFLAQFAINGRKLIEFYGIVPEFLLQSHDKGGANTIQTLSRGSSLLKSNAIFLAEPSNLSQITALGLMIEFVEFRRPRCLLVMAAGLLMAYSGTGLLLLLLFLPMIVLRHNRAVLPTVLMVGFMLGLIATGMVDASVFVNRAGEFEETHSSGFVRYVSPFWLTAQFFDTASLQSLLMGNGPGQIRYFSSLWYFSAPSGWLKQLYEYGIIGCVIFVGFFTACLRKSRCPGLILAAVILIDLWAAGFLSTWFLAIMIVLCTLHSSEPRAHSI